MSNRFRTASLDDGCLFPMYMRARLPEDHLCWAVTAAVRELDLSAFRARYRSDGQGNTAYDPVMMTGLLFYCLLKGIRSCRKVAAACADDVGAIVICDGLRPSYSTVWRFFTRHRPELKQLFVQVLGLCVQDGLVDPSAAAVDGSPVSANAAMSSNAGAGKIAAQIAALDAEIGAAAEEMFAELERNGTAQPLLDGWDGDDDDGGPAGGAVSRVLAAKIRKLGVLRRAADVLAARASAAPRSPDTRAARWEAKARQAEENAARMTAEAQARADADTADRAEAAAAGKPARRGGKPVPPEKSKAIARERARAGTLAARAAAVRAGAGEDPVKVSVTDPDSRLIPRKGGGYDQAWNLQAGAASRQVLLYIGLHDSPNDKEALVPAVTEATANAAAAAGLQEIIAAWLADNGYASAANFETLTRAGMNLLVSVWKEAIQTGRQHGSGGTVPHAWQDMAARLGQPANSDLYKRRSPTVEPVFAQLFARFGRYLSRRGYDAADTEAKVLGTVHNLAKLIAARQRNRKRQRPRLAAA